MLCPAHVGWKTGRLQAALQAWCMTPTAALITRAPAQAVVGQRFSSVLLAATPISSDGLDARHVAQLALASCHPVVTAARRARPLWADVARRLPAIPELIAGEMR